MCNFINKCLIGNAFIDEIDDYIDEWHDCNCTLELHEFLGMTEEEYKYFVMDEDNLPLIINSRRFKRNIRELIQESQDDEFAFAARTSDYEKAKILIDFLKNESLESI